MIKVKIDKSNTDFIRVDMTPQEYDAFARLMKAMNTHLKDYKGGK